MARFNKINPVTKKVYKLQELYDLYEASQKKVEALEATTSLEYSWNTICRQARSLIIDRAKADTKTITREISQEVSNFITAKSVYSKPSFEITAK